MANTIIPEHLKTLFLDPYTGDTNPQDHNSYFNTRMVIVSITDAVKCNLLPSTFKKSAVTWFMTLPLGSIADFTYFSVKFLLSQLSVSKTEKVAIAALFTVVQRDGESVKNYLYGPLQKWSSRGSS